MRYRVSRLLRDIKARPRKRVVRATLKADMAYCAIALGKASGGL